MILQTWSSCGSPVTHYLIHCGYGQSLKLRQHQHQHQHQHQLHLKHLRNAKPTKFKPVCLGATMSEDIIQLAHNKVLIAAGVAGAIGQLSKPFTSVFLYGKEFDIRAAFQAGGFPSTHSSSVVAAATIIGLERGFSDSIFGLTLVYAGLFIYDAQGVRREVGIHARTLNKLLAQMEVNTVDSKARDDLINSQSGESISNSDEEPLLSQELSYESKPKNTGLLLRNKTTSESSKELSPYISSRTPLRESIGHTEVEVIAGALLGFLVGLVAYNFMT